MRNRSFFVFLLLSLLSCATVVMAISLFMRREKSDSCDINESPVTNNLPLAWSAAVQNGVAYPVSVGKDMAVVVDRATSTPLFTPFFMPDYSDTILAYNLNDGSTKWRYPGDPSNANLGLVRTLVATDEYVVIYMVRQNNDNDNSNVFVLDAQSGNVVFNKPMKTVEIQLARDKLYVRDLEDRSLHAFDLESGLLIGTVAPPSARGEEGLFFDGSYIYSVYGDHIYKIEANSAASVAELEILFVGNETPSKPARTSYYEGNLIAVLDNALTNYDLREFTLKWGIKPDNAFDLEVWPPAFGEGYIFLLDVSHHLAKYSLENGELIWTVELPQEIEPISAPVYFDNSIYIIFSDGTVRSFSSESATEHVVFATQAYRYHANVSGGYYSYFPGISVSTSSSQLLLSFGCRSIYAVDVSPR